jgi:hypothetical protein
MTKVVFKITIVRKGLLRSGTINPDGAGSSQFSRTWFCFIEAVVESTSRRIHQGKGLINPHTWKRLRGGSASGAEILGVVTDSQSLR